MLFQEALCFIVSCGVIIKISLYQWSINPNVKVLVLPRIAILMCFNVLHMQSPEVRTKVRGQCSPPNNFACSFRMKWLKRLNSPSILFKSAKKIALPNSLGWPLRHGAPQFTQKRQFCEVRVKLIRGGPFLCKIFKAPTPWADGDYYFQAKAIK